MFVRCNMNRDRCATHTTAWVTQWSEQRMDNEPNGR